MTNFIDVDGYFFSLILIVPTGINIDFDFVSRNNLNYRVRRQSKFNIWQVLAIFVPENCTEIKQPDEFLVCGKLEKGNFFLFVRCLQKWLTSALFDTNEFTRPVSASNLVKHCQTVYGPVRTRWLKVLGFFEGKLNP